MKWEDVGGLEDVKKSILDTVQVWTSPSIMHYLKSECSMESMHACNRFASKILYLLLSFVYVVTSSA